MKIEIESNEAETITCPNNFYIYLDTDEIIATPEDLQRVLDSGVGVRFAFMEGKDKVPYDFHYKLITDEDDPLRQELQKAISNGTIRPVWLECESDDNLFREHCKRN